MSNRRPYQYTTLNKCALCGRVGHYSVRRRFVGLSLENEIGMLCGRCTFTYGRRIIIDARLYGIETRWLETSYKLLNAFNRVIKARVVERQAVAIRFNERLRPTFIENIPVVNGWRSPMKSDPNVSAPIVRNSAGLRDAIFDEIDAIRMGKSNPTRANAVAKLATGIVETVRMEIEVQRHLRATANAKPIEDSGHIGGVLGVPLTLGNTRAAA